MKERTRKIGIAIATAGCTTCALGACDFAPQPSFQCSNVQSTNPLHVDSTLYDGSMKRLEVVMSLNVAGAKGKDVITDVTNLVGAKQPGVSGTWVDDNGEMNISLEVDAIPATGAFDVHLSFMDLEPDAGPGCEALYPVQFAVDASGKATVTLGQAKQPLAATHAAIQVLGRHPGVVTMRPDIRPRTQAQVGWVITAGTLEDVEADAVSWHLPSGPGFYQAQLLVDFGARGIAFDTVEVEVA